MFLYFTLNLRFVILSQKLKTNHRMIFVTSNERFQARLTLECFFVSRRSVRLKLKLFYENFFVDSLFVLLVNVTYFELWTKTQTVNVGFVRPCDLMPLEFLPCLALRPFRQATSQCMFRLFLVVPLTVQLLLQGVTMLSKKNLIESLVVKYPYHRGYWKFQKDGIGQLQKTLFSLKITIF